MSEWICFIHPLRDDLAATMTDEEKAVSSVHVARGEPRPFRVSRRRGRE